MLVSNCIVDKIPYYVPKFASIQRKKINIFVYFISTATTTFTNQLCSGDFPLILLLKTLYDHIKGTVACHIFLPILLSLVSRFRI